MATAPSQDPPNVGRPRAEPGDPLGHIETEMLVFARNLEAQARRTDLFRDMDRASYLLARTLAVSGPLSINVLAAALHLDATTVTRQVATMADSGFVARGTDPHDRRVRAVELTAKGRRVMESLRRERRTRVDRLLADFDAVDREDFGRLLERFNDAITQSHR
jgi:DNA-binding MarR family transcriptional regulator